MDRDRKRDNVNISYEWADAVVLLRELEMYKDILIEHCPTMLYVAYYLMGKSNAKEE